MTTQTSPSLADERHKAMGIVIQNLTVAELTRRLNDDPDFSDRFDQWMEVEERTRKERVGDPEALVRMRHAWKDAAKTWRTRSHIMFRTIGRLASRGHLDPTVFWSAYLEAVGTFLSEGKIEIHRAEVFTRNVDAGIEDSLSPDNYSIKKGGD